MARILLLQLQLYELRCSHCSRAWPHEGARCGADAAAGAGAGQAQGHSYILAPQRLAPGDEVTAGQTGAIRPGNCMPLASIPVATQVSNVELYPGRGGQLARSAGVAATLISKGAPLLHPWGAGQPELLLWLLPV